MNTLTQTTRRRQAIVEYANHHNVTEASRRYNVSRTTIYKWLKRYDGHPGSLKDESRKPHHHPNQHTEEELSLIKRMRDHNKDAGLVVLWVKLRQRGYTRTISGLYKALKRMGDTREKPANPKYVSKPYEQMQYPGQKVQIDVKYVPQSCLVGEAVWQASENGGYFYQYTFIDEYSRFRYLEAFQEHNAYASAQFLLHCIERFPYAIECVQTDNGPEFTTVSAPILPERPSLKQPWNGLGSNTRPLSHTLQDTTAKWKEATARTTNTSTQLTSSTPSKTTKSSSFSGSTSTTSSQ